MIDKNLESIVQEAFHNDMDDYLKPSALTVFPVTPKAIRFSESQVNQNRQNNSGVMMCCCAP